MALHVVNLETAFGSFSEPWSPKIVAELNGQQARIARMEGEFVWHRHEEEDELFLVLEGEMELHLRDGMQRVSAGERIVVPRGVEHKPVAPEGAKVLLLEPAGTVNTGSSGGARTVEAVRYKG